MDIRFNHVSERDMDLLFMEEFSANDSFLQLFLQKVKKEHNLDLSGYYVSDIEVSYVDTVLGESDLTVIIQNNSKKIGLLIEDKINAVAQPHQYERYVERGETGIKEQKYGKYFVFIIAPRIYLDGNPSAEKYPLKVTYEECSALFEKQESKRYLFKLQEIKKAVELGHRPYTKVVDEQATSFWNSYVQYMHENYPDVQLKSKVSTKSKNGDWPTYKTAIDLPQVYIHHKMKMSKVDYSYIDLTFNRMKDHKEEIKALLSASIGDWRKEGYRVEIAGKSAVVRLIADKNLDYQKPFAEQAAVAKQHLDMVQRLTELAGRFDSDAIWKLYESVRSEKHNDIRNHQ